MNSRSSAPEPVSHLDPAVLVTYLEKTRWFGGKGRPFAVTGVTRLGRLGTGNPLVDVLLVELTYGDAQPGDAGDVELYQVPLACYADPEHRLDHAFVGWWEDPDHGWIHAYDALHDREATALWLRAFAADATPGDGLVFHRVPGQEIDTTLSGTLFTGEQSNSSVAFGEQSVLKLFRKVTAGPNPDITTHAALTEADSPDVAHLYGWVSHGETHLGMLQEFLRTATDGWDLALTSVRGLFADAATETDVAARDAGGDFAGESGRLGDTLREVHAALRLGFGTGTVDSAFVAEQMAARLRDAVRAAPALAPYADSLRDLFARVEALGDLPVQRVHGDLHLGQTLRTSTGWKLVDFEGEPAKTLEERLLPDSPWRDVAGMLRSFAYAPSVVERQHTGLDDDAAAERHARGLEWAERNQRYFVGAYAGGDLTPDERTLLTAYVADKAVYETVYETRNRPTWADIPLAAIARIGASS